MSKSLAKNTAFMTGASIIQKIISFGYFILVARLLGPELQGIYTTALTFTTVVVVFVDLGITTVTIREVAKNRDQAGKYLSTVLAIKIALGLLSYGALLIAVQLLGYDPLLKTLIYISGVTMLFDSTHLLLYGIARSFGDLRYEAIGMGASQFITLIIGSIALYLKWPLVILIAAYTVPSLLNCIFIGSVLYKKHGLKIWPSLDTATFRHLLTIAGPFALAAIFARFYSYIDTLLLKQLMGAKAVGIYSVAYKITFAFQFLPLALLAGLYPKFSEYFQTNKQKLAEVFEQSFQYLCLLSFPIAAGIFVLAPSIIHLLLGEQYGTSALPLQILILSLVFSFLTFPIGAALNACNRQRTQTTIIGSVMIFNIIANVSLIPIFGEVGAALSALLGNIALTIIGYCIVPQVVQINHKKIASIVGKIFIASIIMGGAVYGAHQMNSLLLSIVVGAITYPIAVLLTGAATIPQLKSALGKVT